MFEEFYKLTLLLAYTDLWQDKQRVLHEVLVSTTALTTVAVLAQDIVGLVTWRFPIHLNLTFLCHGRSVGPTF